MSEDIANRIVFEDNHLIIINKLPGELVQGDKSGDRTLADDVRSFLKRTYNKPGNVFLGIPHRIDRPTSGLVVYTKTEKALERMNALFRTEDGVRKIYWAVVDKLPSADEGLAEHWISRDTAKNKSTATVHQRSSTQLARMRWHVQGASKSFYLLEIELLTGRHHQIRAQLAAMGSHIKGDVKYGSRRSNDDWGIHLHALSMDFAHPVGGRPVHVSTMPPRDPVWDALCGRS